LIAALDPPCHAVAWTAWADRESLTPGGVIEGPAIMEAADTTYAVFPGWKLVVNDLAFYVLTRN
jgi:N-methylhydantoinase A/oxoprolinase/acetone carboxylase beta subunit